ncbi:hypothetical protein [Dehalobacter sp. TeCB1]|uniref:hypothetical protein n=1 Tax=Dehalobacter sp. TeCB1 TaxID=1843715 RepID=UPI00083B2747|nr:hypothetical protein [Dehalobacter sp. TeCB1]OCZ51349.1 hypothetical protein A7D23_13075 [Dehalobacter sp. TeCB1]
MDDRKDKKKEATCNFKLPEDDYIELQQIASKLYGGLSLSDMMRTLTYAQLEKVRKTGDPKAFLDCLIKKD